jgi:hypothetical protein
MIENPILRWIRWYFVLYFFIAAGQFLMFSFLRDIGLVFFLEALLWIAGWTVIAGKLPERSAWLILSVFGLFLKGLWIVWVETPPVSDYALMYNAARELLEGGREYLNNIYFQRFPYQLGFTAYQALVLSVIDSVTVLKLANAFWCAAATLAVYGIARETVSRKAAVLAMLLHATMLPILVLSSVMTNQHIAIAWLYGGIFVWIKAGHTWKGAIAAGALLAIGNIMRPIGIIVIAAILVNELLPLVRKSSGKTAAAGHQRSKNRRGGTRHTDNRRSGRTGAAHRQAEWTGLLRARLLRAGTCIAAYAVVLALAGLILAQTGISPDGLRNNDPLWKFVVGLNASMNGSYSHQDERLVNYGYMDPQKRSALERDIIFERLTDLRNMVKLPFVKIGKLWADYQPDWFTFPNREGTAFHYLGWPVPFDEAIGKYRKFERAVFYLLALAAFWGIVRHLRDQDRPWEPFGTGQRQQEQYHERHQERYNERLNERHSGQQHEQHEQVHDQHNELQREWSRRGRRQREQHRLRPAERRHHNLNLLILILGAHTFIHLWVEVQPRYMYFLFGILLIFSARELIRLEGWLRERLGTMSRRTSE